MEDARCSPIVCHTDFSVHYWLEKILAKARESLFVNLGTEDEEMIISLKNVCVVGVIVFVCNSTQSAQAQINTPSGLLLGIYCHACDQGLHVDSVMRGEPADGHLQSGDHILNLGNEQTGERYLARSLRQLEWAKSRIGPDVKAPLQFLRNHRLAYATVVFRRLGTPTGRATYRAEIRTDTASASDAREFFEGSPGESSSAREFFEGSY